MEYLVLSGFKLVKETGETKAEVENKLLDQGIVPSLIIRNFFKSEKILSNKEAANFFESLPFLFRSTGSMTKSLKFLEDRYDKTKVKFHYNSKIKDFISTEFRKYLTEKYKKRLELARNLRRKLESGYTLSGVLKEYKFDEIVVGLANSAETGTGDWVTVFKKIADYYTTKDKNSKSLIKELAYPMVLLLAAFSGFLVFIFYVIPAFDKFFKSFPNVPAATKATLGFFMNINHYFAIYGLTILIIVGILAYIWISNYKDVRGKFYKRLAATPGIGHFFRFSYLKWYLYEYSVLLSAGKTHASIVKYLLDNAKNDFFKDKFTVIYSYLLNGSTLTEGLNSSDLLRPEDLDRISSAEVGGRIDETMLLISEEYEEVVNLQMKLIGKIANYVMLVVIAGFIVFMFAGIYAPMMQGLMGMAGG
jgi:type II secretory pathway component PulF